MVQWNEFQWNHQNWPESRCFLMRKILAKIQTLKGHLTWKYWYDFHEWNHINKKKPWKSRQNMKLDRLVGRGLCNPKWWTFTHRQYRISIYWSTTKWFVTLFGFTTGGILFLGISTKIFVFAICIERLGRFFWAQTLLMNRKKNDRERNSISPWERLILRKSQDLTWIQAILSTIIIDLSSGERIVSVKACNECLTYVIMYVSSAIHVHG